MAKQRFEGRPHGAHYRLIGPDGSVLREIPMGEARADSKLAAAIKRNGWAPVPKE